MLYYSALKGKIMMRDFNVTKVGMNDSQYHYFIFS